ncbi:MAG: hypothetical protein EBR10_09785 [Planctomycetes bacterium]|nr:hypothetical protein [Planctomycetota bacterium]
MSHPRVGFLLVVIALLSSATAQADWPHLGGNSMVNGLVPSTGPQSAALVWQRTNIQTLISWSPTVSGDRIFWVRQTQASNPVTGPGDSVVYCLSLATGATLWTFDCPFQAGDWTTVVYGARGDRVYVGRGGNGSASAAPVYCLDAANGSVVWTSDAEVSTGSYDGIVFLENGDPIFAGNTEMRRLRANDGTTVWFTTRTCSVSGNCGPARDGDAIYLDEVGSGGQRISRFSATTGQRLYSGPVMPGFLCQNSPFCAPGGLVFYLRTSNSGSLDQMYAFRDTGSAIELLWNVPAGHEPFARHAITPDGGVTMMSLEGKLQIRDQITGALRAESAGSIRASHGFTSSLTVVDAQGRVFHNNSHGAGGGTADIRVFNPAMQQQWSLAIAGVSQGGPVLTANGSLVVSSTGSVRRYWTPSCSTGDLNCDGAVNGSDLSLLLAAWGAGGPSDLNGDGVVSGADLTILLGLWG